MVAAVAGSTERLPVAILGLGRIGHTFGVGPDGDPLSHSAAYRESGGADVVAAVDPEAGARDAFQESFSSALLAARPEDLPEDLDVRVVSVCTPDPMHAASVRAALHWNPAAILCEKPLAPTAVESEAIVEACARSGCALVVNYSRRWTLLYRALQSALQEHAIGVPRGAVLRYDGDLLHNGSHGVDLLLGLFGLPAQAEGDDGALVLRWEDGFEARLLRARGTEYSIFEGEVWGSEGVLRLAEQGSRLELDAAAPGPWAGVRTLGSRKLLAEDALRGHLLDAVRETLRLAREGGTPTCSGRDALEVVRLIERARRAGG